MVAAGPEVAAAPPKGPPLTKVQLRELPSLASKGKGAIYKGKADKEGVAFYVEGIGIATPVAVFLFSDKGVAMTVRLKNDMSADWDRKVDTDPKTGMAETRFRTEGPAMLLVSSPGELSNYQLVIWAGPDIKFHKMVKPPFVTQAVYDKTKGAGGGGPGGGGSDKIIAVVVVIALLAVIGFIASRQLKKKKKGAAA